MHMLDLFTDSHVRVHIRNPLKIRARWFETIFELRLHTIRKAVGTEALCHQSSCSQCKEVLWHLSQDTQKQHTAITLW